MAAVQHLLGLAMAVVIYLLLMRRGVTRWLAALAIAPVLLDAYQVQIEQMIMPDTWFEALIVAGLAILLWRPAPGWRRVIAGGVVLGTSATVAQVGEALILPAVIYLLAAGGGWRQAARQGGRGVRGLRPADRGLLRRLLRCSPATSSCPTRASRPSTAGWRRPRTVPRCGCPRPSAACARPRPQQARGPDWLEYAEASPVQRYYTDLPRAEVDSLISDFNHRVLHQQPLRVARAYARDVAKLFALTRDGRHG